MNKPFKVFLIFLASFFVLKQIYFLLVTYLFDIDNHYINKINQKFFWLSPISVFQKSQLTTETLKPKKDLTNDFDILVQDIKNINPSYSTYINDLYSQKKYLYNENQNYYSASLFKIPIAVATLMQLDQQNITLQDTLEYKSYHATIGTGFIYQNPVNTFYTYDQLLIALLKNSDNTAQTMLEEKFNVNSSFIRNGFGSFGNTNFYLTNQSNAFEIGEYLEQIYSSNLLTDSSKDYLFNTMQGTEFDDYLANYLLGGFANKIGLSGSSIHNCGVILTKDIVVCVMSQNTNKTQFIEISKLIADFVNKL